MNDSFYSEILKNLFGADTKLHRISSVAGGCINQTSKLESSQGTFFIKVNSSTESDLFEKEEKGLRYLKEKSDLGIPDVLGSGVLDGKVYLVLSWIEKGQTSNNFWKSFGHLLAKQHRETNNHFGLDHNNHIGRLQQSNKNHSHWDDFFIEERLKPQLKLAEESGLIDQALMNSFDLLFRKLGDLIPIEKPAFLHGDLWSGNFLSGSRSTPYVFDPAIYYGHRETELAFTTMFGGFDRQFYESYEEEFPIEPGFEDRIEIHNLYPLLVHVNLFGTSYLSGVLSTLKKFA